MLVWSLEGEFPFHHGRCLVSKTLLSEGVKTCILGVSLKIRNPKKQFPHDKHGGFLVEFFLAL